MEKKDLRIVFMGTPEFAVATLRRLVEGGYRVVGVVTQPDKPVGRHGSVLRQPPVKQYALQQGIPVLQPEKMKDPEFLQALAAWKADMQVVVAFRMLPECVWAMPPMGTFNVHAALLPQYRGAAPINWAVINGEEQTGVTTFFIDRHMDTGSIIMQRTFPIPAEADAGYVHDGLMALGAEAAADTVDMAIAAGGRPESKPQYEPSEPKPAPKIFKETCRVDWTLPAKRVRDFVRGLSPHPSAWTLLSGPADTEVKIHRAADTGVPAGEEPGTLSAERGRLLVAAADNWVEIAELQPAGKKRMAAKDFLNGFRDIGSHHCE